MHPHHSLRRLSYPTAYGVARDPLDGSARVRAENFLHSDATDARWQRVSRACTRPTPVDSTQALGRPSAPSIPPPSRSGAQSTSRSSRSIADSRISRDRSPILRCGSAHTLLLSACRRRRVPNLLIMFLIYCSRRKFTILVFQNTMPACQNSHIGLPALRKFRSRGG